MTSIIGGEKVTKSSERVKSYGEVDELNSYIGIIISQMTNYFEIKGDLQEIQQILFDCGTDLATPNASKGYRTKKEYVTWLEEKIDHYESIPPEIKEFILPGGVTLAARLHYARALSRRVERQIVALQSEEEINGMVIQLINRLSDYFFVMARYINFREDRKDINYRRNKQIFF